MVWEVLPQLKITKKIPDKLSYIGIKVWQTQGSVN